MRKVEDLKRELKEVRTLAEELHNALRAEQLEKSKLQVMSLLGHELPGSYSEELYRSSNATEG